MKKYWKIRTNSDLKTSLKILKVPDNYIKILLEDDSNVMNHINDENPEYILITYNEGLNTIETEYFGWDKIDNEYWIECYGYKFSGTINLRKEKLKKLNELHKSTV